MKSWARRAAVLCGLFTAVALTLCQPVRVSADTVKSEVELTTKDVDAKENALGGLVADAVREAANADAAFVVAAAFAENVSLPKGSVNTADILKAVPSDYRGDNILIVKLTGAQITRALEHGLYLYPKPNSGFLQVSGLAVTVNGKAEKERRVASVKVGGDALDAGKTYKVAMPAPLANGALGYRFWKKSDIEKDTGKTLEAALTAYFRAHKTIEKGGERLAIKEK